MIKISATNWNITFGCRVNFSVVEFANTYTATLQHPRPTQPPILCGTGNECRRWCAAAGGAGWLIPFLDERAGGRL